MAGALAFIKDKTKIASGDARRRCRKLHREQAVGRRMEERLWDGITLLDELFASNKSRGDESCGLGFLLSAGRAVPGKEL
jgi:hypothetical protein